MKRRTFDILIAVAGLFLAVTLAVAGGLALWGHNFIGSQVHNQLAAQKIYFPPASAFAHPKAGTEITPSMIPSVSRYAGQQMLTGQQAEVWANDFIAVHLVEIGGGKTYAQLSTEAIAQPKNLALQGQVATMFKGETLRGLLLNAYAFGTMGTIAGIAAIGAFIAALVMLILGGLGLAHARRVTPGTEILPGHPAHNPDPAPDPDTTLVPATLASHNGHPFTVPGTATPTA
jgi:hypothetical protein